MKIKKGDKVIVIAGKDRGKTGTVSKVLSAQSLIVIEGVNMVKKHRRATQRARKGQVIDKAMPLHISNVQIVDPKTGKGTRVKINRDKDGARERVTVKSGSTLS
jgi:large subunit ribosomal protein L24